MDTIPEWLASAVQFQQGGQSEHAEVVCRQILDIEPDQPDAIHLLGVIAHQSGRYDVAIELIRRAISLKADESTYHSNLGAAYRAIRKLTKAINCFKHALQLRPDDPVAHNNLAAVLNDQRRFDDAIARSLRALQLKPDFAEAYFNLGVARQNQGELDEAADCFLQALKFRPESAAAHYSLGAVRAAQGRFEDAVAGYQSALAIAPDDADTLNGLGVALSAQGHLRRAVDCFDLALHLRPNSAKVQNNLGNTRQVQGRLDDAVACYRRVLQLRPDDADAYNNLGVAFSDQGRLHEAVICYRRALQLRPAYADAHCNLGTYHQQMGDVAEAEREFREALRHDPAHVLGLAELANMLRARLPAIDVSAMTEAAANPRLSMGQRSMLHFGLAVVLDAQRDYSEASEHVRQANSQSLAVQCRRGQSFDPGAHVRFVDALIDVFSVDHFERVKGFGIDSERPVFIFGLPRSGTTLTEQILACHSQVKGAGELELGRRAFESLPQIKRQPGSPVESVGDLDHETTVQLAQQYLDKLLVLDEFALHVVDKLPENYLYLGLLTTLFPRAKLIHCRRDLRDTAVSCWMTDFHRLRWTNQYEHIATVFRAYERIMDHWKRVLPVPMLEVDYEDTVANVEATARRLVNWCGLSWEPRCVEFHLYRRPVQTASVTQVRQPIYRHAVGRWKHYQKSLAPLFALLRGRVAQGVSHR